MRPESRAFVCGLLALLAASSAGARDPARAPPQARTHPVTLAPRLARPPHVSPAPVRARAPAAGGARPIPAPLRWTVPLSALSVARPALARGIAGGLPVAAGAGHRAPANSALGGPATLDARRLVRR